MSPTDLLIPTYRQMLRTLAGLLDKAAQQMPGRADAVLAARLADDSFRWRPRSASPRCRRRRRCSACAASRCPRGWRR